MTFDGSKWSAPTYPEGLYGADLNVVSCRSSRFCVAGTRDGTMTTFNGTAWSGQTAALPHGIVHSIACASATFCAATDATRVVTFDGSAWSAPVALNVTGVDLSVTSGAGPGSGWPWPPRRLRSGVPGMR